MNREEALQDFKKAIEDRIRVQRKDFYEAFQNKKEAYQEKLREGFCQLCDLTEEKAKEAKVGIIWISYLRSHILDGSYQWYFEAQGPEGYLGEELAALTLDFSFLFSSLEQLQTQLQKAKEAYYGKVTDFDIEQIKLDEFEFCVPILYYGALQAFRSIAMEACYEKLKKAALFSIFLGEYMGTGQLLHLADQKLPKKVLIEELQKEEEEIAEDEKKPALLRSDLFTRRDYSACLFQNSTIVMKNMFYSILRESQIKESIFLFCNLIGTDFSKTEVVDSYFQICTLQNASFEEACIRDTGFAGSSFSRGEYTEEGVLPGLYPVSFRHCHLRQVDFSYADLRGCDFRGAFFDQVLFREANLAGAFFDVEALSTLVLTKEQRNAVIAGEGRMV